MTESRRLVIIPVGLRLFGFSRHASSTTKPPEAERFGVVMNKEQTGRIVALETSRLDQDVLEVAWKSSRPGLTVEISAGTDPFSPHLFKPLTTAIGRERVRFDDLERDRRYYFRLAAGTEKPLLTAERRLPLEGAVNFRDLGGYETADGRRVAWGRVFRSDGLSRLTDWDRQYLSRLGLKAIFDFRTMGEVEAAPDLPPLEVKYINLPIAHGEFNFVEAMKKLKKGDSSWMTPDFMLNGYLDNLDNHGPTFGRVFRALAERSNRPLVFHCTGGKDRAGTAAALLLLTLGVPDDAIIADHALSNIYIAALLEKVYELIRSHGVDPEVVAPYFTAPRECIVALLEHLKKKYGDIDSYLTEKAGLDQETIDILRADLLD
ncbi:MAG: tyrosine-protein phosphatase [Pseudomonadota bacterium]